jgi:hypothetical protein
MNEPDVLNEVIKDIGRGLYTAPWDTRPGGVVMIGDLSSDEKGSGARMNADKLAVEQIPVRCWHKLFHAQMSVLNEDKVYLGQLLDLVEALAAFQEGKADGLQLLHSVPAYWFEDAIAVFVYGAKKYKRWNWLKGQAWSVPMASAIRHARAVFAGEIVDRESGLAHTGHFTCNLIMLATFYDTYKEGNDFPDPKFFEAGK